VLLASPEIHHTLDWSEELSSEINNNVELVLDIDVKKNVKTGSSIVYAQFRTKYLFHFFKRK
jgi:hypothetical protein